MCTHLWTTIFWQVYLLSVPKLNIFNSYCLIILNILFYRRHNPYMITRKMCQIFAKFCSFLYGAEIDKLMQYSTALFATFQIMFFQRFAKRFLIQTDTTIFANSHNFLCYFFFFGLPMFDFPISFFFFWFNFWNDPQQN